MDERAKKRVKNTEEDRLSTLPEYLIHHILSFLTIFDVIRMCCLSKKWKTMWIDIPVLKIQEFNDPILKYNPLFGNQDQYKKSCKKQLQKKFVELVENCLNRRRHHRHQNQRLTTSFKLYLEYFYGQPTGNIKSRVIDGWLNSVTKTNTVKELDICIKSGGYSIPKSVLSNASSSLTILRLEGINLNPNSTISFPFLASISLIDLNFKDFKTIESLFSRCPFIKDLHLGGLYMFSKYGMLDNYLNVINLSGSVCGSLRSLSLCRVSFIDLWLKDVICGLPSLERLTIDSCDGLRDFNIRSQTLKSFNFYPNPDLHTDFCDYRGNISGTIDTPNLVYFNYKGYENSTILIKSPNLLEADVKLLGYCTRDTWYFHMILFLSCLNCSSSTKLKLFVPWRKALAIPEIIKRICCPPLPDLKHIKVKIKNMDEMTHAYNRRKKQISSRFDEETTDDEINNDDDVSIDDIESIDGLLWLAPSAETHEIECV